MNLQQLEYIIALDKTKSFSVAAGQCHITQATLSTMVKKLEEELDLVLFDRKSNPIITTECGKEIIELAKLSVGYSNQIKDLSNHIKDKIEGVLKIGIIPTIANNLLPLITKDIINKYPNLKLEIKEITTEGILKQLKEGNIDAGIISTPFKNTEIFEEQILYYELLYIYGNAETNKQYILPKNIINEKVWLLEEGHCLRDQFINLCSLNKKKVKENLEFKSSSFETLLNMVDIFGGLTVIPELYLNNLSSEKKKKIIQFSSPYPVREVSMIYYRPYAKYRLINKIVTDIKQLVIPVLKTKDIKKSKQIIVKG